MRIAEFEALSRWCVLMSLLIVGTLATGCSGDPTPEREEGCHAYCVSYRDMPPSGAQCENLDGDRCGVMSCPDEGGIVCTDTGPECSDGERPECEEFTSSCEPYCIPSTAGHDADHTVRCLTDDSHPPCGSPSWGECPGDQNPECDGEEPVCPDGSPVECGD